MNGKELETINVTITCNTEVNNYKETLSVYDNEGEEHTSITSENKVKACDGYVRMYGLGKRLFYSAYDRMCASQETIIGEVK